ncbi:MAG: ribbon-helix-helix protein, CopG family [Candidatus Competibacteraceae bacterium]|nr:ribbon-helix-helix protein, CopG family [Candidatus Competibacteraceae bacterium]
MTHRTTFALDDSTASRLKRLAARWKVSQAEVVRRSVEKADQAESQSLTAEERIAAAHQLRENLKGRITAEAWIAMVQDARR